MALPNAAAAADWTGVTDSDWFVATNWIPNAVPTLADFAFIDAGTVLVTNSGAQAQQLFLGSSASGELHIFAGGTLAIGSIGSAGALAGGSGVITIDGAGSSMTVGSSFVFGDFGRGDLGITNGGLFRTTGADGRVYVGNGSTGSSLITLAGSGSALETAGGLYFGVAGSAEMIVSGGAQVLTNWNYVTSEGFVLGQASGGYGHATFIEEGTTLAVMDDLIVGGAGTGFLYLLDGADASVSGPLSVGQAASGNGSLAVQGAGSTMSVVGRIRIGENGSGDLVVSDGGSLVSDDYVFIGGNGGSVGNATLTGAGSNWTSNGAGFFVGDGGAGTLAISDGASLQHSDIAVLGVSAGAAGTVTVTGSGSIWSNTGALTLGEDGDGTLTIAEGGSVAANAGLVIAQNAGSTGTLDIGAASGGTAVAPGALSAPSIAFGAGAGVITFNHTGTNYGLGADISGLGAINQVAGVTELTGNSSGFTGMTTVTGGSLYVNGNLGGVINVASGTLGGSGTANHVSLGTGGTFAPGNSIGTLTVTTATFNPGSIYEVEVDSGGGSDLVSATGTVTINGGTVNVAPFPDYALGTVYTIVSAAGGVSSTFDDATFAGGSIFVTPTLTYDANNVYLSLSQTATFVSVALTPNQKATAAGVESVGAGNSVYDAVLGIGGADAARAAYDALSGEIHGSVRTGLIEGSRFLRDAASERIRMAFDGEASGSVPLLAYGDDGDTGITVSARPGPAWWGTVFGAAGKWNSDGNAGALNRGEGGFVIGADGGFSDTVRLGVLAEYSHSGLNADSRASSATTDSYRLGFYGGAKTGSVSLRFGGSIGWHQIATSRLPAFAGFSETLTAGYSAVSGQVFGEVSHAFEAGHIRYEPYAGIAHVRLSTDGFAESGGDAALTGTDATTNATFATLGIRGERDAAFGGTQAKVTGGIGWRHALSGTAPTTQMAFGSGNSFAIAGVPVAADLLMLELGARFALGPDAALDLGYSGQIGMDAHDHSFSANYTRHF
ncbi:MAG: autotransporter domain-containing protein [Oricola sp.]